jgi:hypothetical protein
VTRLTLSGHVVLIDTHSQPSAQTASISPDRFEVLGGATFAASLVPVAGPLRSLNPVFLRFADPKRERQYRDDQLGYRFNAVRVAAIAGAAVWLLRAALADDFDFSGPHMIDVKGKGPTSVWFLHSLPTGKRDWDGQSFVDSVLLAGRFDREPRTP